MKICQTLCCDYKELLQDSFGWYSPQHHLMAWTYSCLKLKEFYDDVELYTDSQGASFLIDKINIPYTEYHVDYDQLRCDPMQWAYSKILTYQKQEEAFIHVDGDVFVWERFNDNLLNASLIAQNLEVSTEFYNNLFKPLLKRISYIPEFFKENLLSQNPKSYNAGILGGNDVDLLHKYSTEALNFVDQNYFCHSNGNFNMIFEQLLFYSFVESHNVDVMCYFDKIYDDNGYVLSDFADFLSVSNLKYFHLVGPLKRDKFVCDQLARLFFTEYPNYFEKVVSLFPLSHKYFPLLVLENNEADTKYPSWEDYSMTKSLISKLYSVNGLKNHNSIVSFVKEKNNKLLNEVFEYEEKLFYWMNQVVVNIDVNDLRNIEKKIASSDLLGLCSSIKGICLNPHIEIIETTFDVIKFDLYELLRDERGGKVIACVPQLFNDGYKEVLLDDISINIIATLQEESSPITFVRLKEKMTELFERVNDDDESISSLIVARLKFLIGNNLVFLDENVIRDKLLVVGDIERL